MRGPCYYGRTSNDLPHSLRKMNTCFHDCRLRSLSRCAAVCVPTSVAAPPYGLPSAPHPVRYRLTSALRRPPLHSVIPADTPARLGSDSTDGAAPSLHPPHLAHFPVRRGDGEGGRGSIHPPPQWWQDQKTSTLCPIAEPGVEADGRAPRLSTGAGRNVPSRCLTGALGGRVHHGAVGGGRTAFGVLSAVVASGWVGFGSVCVLRGRLTVRRAVAFARHGVIGRLTNRST